MDAGDLHSLEVAAKRLAAATDTLDPFALFVLSITIVECVPEPHLTAVLEAVEKSAIKLETKRRLK